MTDNSLHEKLVALGADKLASLLIEQSYKDDALDNKLNFAVLKSDPKKLAKRIKSRVSGIMRRKPSFNRSHASELAAELSDILDSITDDLFPEQPEEAIKIMEDLLNKAGKIHERADDSYGSIGDFFRGLSQEIGKCWATIKDVNEEELAEKIFESMLSNDYGEKDNLIPDMAEALGAKGLDKLKEIFIARRNEYEDEYSKIDGPLKEIADAKNDPDEYIALLLEKSEIQTYEVCDVAKRLISYNRENEAIKWLLEKPNNITSSESQFGCNLSKVNPHKYRENERYDLLLSAYKQGNYITELEHLAWKLFELTLSKNYYDIATERKDGEDLSKLKDIAISLILDKPDESLSTCLIFLEEMKEYELTSKLVLTNHERINKESYYFYRPLSTKLEDNGFSLAACILRRKLIEGVLEKAQSKYYNYAVSDLSCAKKYAANVIDWQEFNNHDEYMLFLKQNHGRKPSFWSKVKGKKLDT